MYVTVLPNEHPASSRGDVSPAELRFLMTVMVSNELLRSLSPITLASKEVPLNLPASAPVLRPEPSVVSGVDECRSSADPQVFKSPRLGGFLSRFHRCMVWDAKQPARLPTCTNALFYQVNLHFRSSLHHSAILGTVCSQPRSLLLPERNHTGEISPWPLRM